jgi:hypothetical protein
MREMWLEVVPEGTKLIEQGSLGQIFYVVETGNFDIFVRSGDEKKKDSGKKVASCGVGTSFGELALMYNAPRAATVESTEECRVWGISRYAYRQILTNINVHKMDEYEEFLRGVPGLVGGATALATFICDVYLCCLLCSSLGSASALVTFIVMPSSLRTQISR